MGGTVVVKGLVRDRTCACDTVTAMDDQRSLRVAHLYPDIMNVYGDRGNIIALRHRCEARGIAFESVDVTVGDTFDPSAFDIVHIGGGQDREQRRISDDLRSKGDALLEAVENGQPMLIVCGGFQLFGHCYVDHEGNEIAGIGVFDMETRHPGPRADRCIGDVVLATDFGEVVGFENHGGRTFLAAGQSPFGTVIRGFGNDGERRKEGAVVNNAIGTYLHGSLLPKNPTLTDHLVLTALRRNYGHDFEFEPLMDMGEASAHRSAVSVANGRSRAGR